MDFRMLGPMEVIKDGRPIDLGHHKRRSLLALLAINANRVVSTDRILDEIWGEDAVGKENTLWVYVSRIRSALGGDDLLVTKDHGYSLVTPSESIDVNRFEAAVEEGRELLRTDAAAGIDVLRSGLDMWRGSALQDFEYDEFARLEIARLEELRLSCLETKIDGELKTGLAGELVGELQGLHETYPLRERFVEQLMLALYRSGRQAEALRIFERYRRSTSEEMGLDPSPELVRLEEQILLHDSRLQPARTERRAALVTDANPYKGLRAFEEDDVEDFFGRERLIAEAARRLKSGDQLLAFIGPSGSGKSSVVRAGLVPTLRKGAVPGSDRWLVARMLPGAQPFVELEAALLRSTLDAPESLAAQLGDGDHGLLRAALRLLPDDESKLVLVVDQFEEMFTLVDDEDVRTRFIDNLSAALADPRGRVIVVLSLRADFYSRPLEYPDFGERLGSAVMNVVPLSPDEYETAAMEPAKRVGATLEPKLLAELLTDVVGQPGALPLFQFCLTELFDQREGDWLTAAAYRTMGGVGGVLTKRAEDVFSALDEDQRAVLTQLFLRLVTITEDGQSGRRRVRAAEILSLGLDPVTLEHVIGVFGAARLLSFDRDQVSGSPTVEVAHEALLNGWSRLSDWIEGVRDDLRRHATFAVAMREWVEADRNPEYLPTGSRLDEYERWANASELRLTRLETEFLEAALTRQRATEEAESERVQEEERLRKGARRRTWGLVAAFALLIAAASALFVALRPEGPRVALVYWGPDGTGGVLDLLSDGWNDAVGLLDFEGEEVVPLIDPAEDIRELAASGVGLIIVELFDVFGLVEEIAADYPDTQFVVFGGDAAEPNMTAIHFVRENGSYLMGVAAGLATNTDRIGFVGGAQQETTEARRSAYTQGARSVNPDVDVTTIYLGPLSDQFQGYSSGELGRQAATTLYRDGVDVIHHSAGDSSTGIAEAAVELSPELGRHLWVIGSETDEYLIRPPDQKDHILTSMYKRWDDALGAIIESYINGELVSGVVAYDLDSGLVAYSTAGGHVEPHVGQLDAASADITAGSVVASGVSNQAPAWTREADVVGTVEIDTTCRVSVPADVSDGTMLRFDVTNSSADAVGVSLSGPDWGPTTWTAPGATNALAVVAEEGEWTIECFDETGQGLGDQVFAVQPGLVCDREATGTNLDDPSSVILALEAAVNDRDAGKFCSLFAEDAIVFESGEEPIGGREDITLASVPNPDDVEFVSFEVMDIRVSGDTVIFTERETTIYQTILIVDNRVVVEDGLIAEWTFGEVMAESDS